MRDQLHRVLMACVGALALLAVFGWSTSAAYVLLPTLPLLAAMYAMHWVKGVAYIWWYRFAIPWTVAAMGAVLISPASAKPFVSILFVWVLSIVTIVIVTYKFILPHYRIARSETS